MAGEQLFINRPLPGAQINQSHPLVKGLVGCWLLNEQAGIRCIDSSPYNNHGTMVGFGVPANSRSGQGIKFDGVTDYVDVGNVTRLNITYTITVSAWVKANSVSGVSIASKYDYSANKRSWAFRGGIVSTDKILVILSDNGTDIKKRYESGITVFDNTWKHISFVFDGTNLSLYINGILDTNPNKTTDSAISGLYSSDIPITIGILLNSGVKESYFNGSINNVHIYNRALNKDEIKELYLNPYAMFKR